MKLATDGFLDDPLGVVIMRNHIDQTLTGMPEGDVQVVSIMKVSDVTLTLLRQFLLTTLSIARRTQRTVEQPGSGLNIVRSMGSHGQDTYGHINHRLARRWAERL